MPLDASEVHQDDRLAGVPDVDPAFVPYGRFGLLTELLLKPKIWAPIYIPGPTGVGKTSMVLQACARVGRPVLRYNVTSETDRDHLIGGFRLIGGQTVFELGPVPRAMIDGYVLLLDEIDLGKPERLLCLQPVMERNGVFIAETGQRILPHPEFAVVATANTKGRGSDTGTYIGANVQNEAFLERFAVTLEHGYPDATTEKEIIEGLRPSKITPEEIQQLLKWAHHSRDTFDTTQEGAVISPRRLCFIVTLYESLSYSLSEIIKLALARFEERESAALADLWEKLTPPPLSVNVRSKNKTGKVSYDLTYSKTLKQIVVTAPDGKTLALTPFV
jgi:MoxR-like ATPase